MGKINSLNLWLGETISKVTPSLLLSKAWKVPVHSSSFLTFLPWSSAGSPMGPSSSGRTLATAWAPPPAAGKMHSGTVKHLFLLLILQLQFSLCWVRLGTSEKRPPMQPTSTKLLPWTPITMPNSIPLEKHQSSGKKSGWTVYSDSKISGRVNWYGHHPWGIRTGQERKIVSTTAAQSFGHVKEQQSRISSLKLVPQRNLLGFSC